MKKSFIYGLAAMASLVFASCNGDYDDWATPQQNGPEAAITLPGYTATAAATDVNLANPGENVKVFNLSQASLPEGTTLDNARIVITPTDETALDPQPQTITNANTDGTVDSTALQNAVIKAYGKRPLARPFKVHVYADVNISNQRMWVDAGEFNLIITPRVVKALSYCMVGGVYGWDDEHAAKLAFYSEGDKKISMTTQWTGDANLKVWNRSDLGDWTEAFGTAVDGDNSASGTLINNNANAFVCPEKGAYYTLEIDMSDNSYKWTKLENQAPASYESVGIMGSFNSWGDEIGMEQTAPHNWYVRKEFKDKFEMKFRANHAWDVSWGGATAKTDEFIYTSAVNGDNLKDIPAGTYDIYFNDITCKFMIVTVE